MSATFRSHLLTIVPALRTSFFSFRAPPATDWWTTIDDPAVGVVRLSGKLSDAPGSTSLVVIVHGLAGGPDSPYCRRMAQQLWDRGISSLRLALRGADLLGHDVHHAALAEDLVAAVESPALQRYRDLFVLGYSLGGHMVLHAATRSLPDNLRKIAVVCPPFDLASCRAHVDETTVYRRNLVAGLRAIHRPYANRRDRSDMFATKAIRSILDWDENVICKRFGFASPDEYYETKSVGGRYADSSRPLLIVGSKTDPLVPYATVKPHLVGGPNVTIRYYENEGHVYFSAKAGLDRALFDWFSV